MASNDAGNSGEKDEELRMQIDDAVQAVRGAVATAFAETPRVPRQAMVYSDSWEALSLLENLATVEDAPNARFIEWNAGSLAAFTAVGLRHVLPFYLLYSLENPESDVTERVIFHLSPADQTEKYWQDRLEAFTSAQKHAICAYVRLMQSALAGQHYEEHLARALTVWGCS